MHRILAVVADRGIDFRDYRPDTLRNRLESRMRAAGCADLATYHARLITERDEIDRLVESLVVPVTEFFRDGWVFRELAERVLPTLPTANGVLRAWVVGTATGEEAYTVAMLLAQEDRPDGGVRRPRRRAPHAGAGSAGHLARGGRAVRRGVGHQ